MKLRLSTTDMAHYRLLKAWRNGYRESLKQWFPHHIEHKTIAWDGIELYEKVCAQLAVLRQRGLHSVDVKYLLTKQTPPLQETP